MKLFLAILTAAFLAIAESQERKITNPEKRFLDFAVYWVNNMIKNPIQNYLNNCLSKLMSLNKVSDLAPHQTLKSVSEVNDFNHNAAINATVVAAIIS